MGYPTTVDSGGVQPWSLYADDNAYSSTTTTGGAIYIVGVVLYAPVVVTGMKCRMGSTAAGNIDMGIYDVNFNVLANKGATGSLSASAVNTLTFANALSLSPGRYWLAWVDSAGSDTVAQATAGSTGFTIARRSVGTGNTTIVANSSWQDTTIRICLEAAISGGYP